MKDCKVLYFCMVLVLVFVHGVNSEDPYRFFMWKVTYGDIVTFVGLGPVNSHLTGIHF